MSKRPGPLLVPLERIQSRIWVVRSRNVILDDDLADLYGMEVREVVRAVERNRERFPDDFLFELRPSELAHMKDRAVAGGADRTGPTFAFTEQGIAMLSGILRNPRAVQMNIEVLRAFEQLRGLLGSYEKLERKLLTFQRRVDAQLEQVFDTLQKITDTKPPTAEARRRVGFKKVKGRRTVKTRDT